MTKLYGYLIVKWWYLRIKRKISIRIYYSTLPKIFNHGKMSSFLVYSTTLDIDNIYNKSDTYRNTIYIFAVCGSI